jgi:hypothetical protein
MVRRVDNFTLRIRIALKVHSLRLPKASNGFFTSTAAIQARFSRAYHKAAKLRQFVNKWRNSVGQECPTYIG